MTWSVRILGSECSPQTSILENDLDDLLTPTGAAIQAVISLTEWINKEEY